jgi:hypothetical protein
LKARYPIFLSKNPSFLGLEIIDLFLIGIGLILSLTLKLSSLIGLSTTIVLIIGRVALARFIDIKGILYSRKNVSVDWKKLIQKERQS